MLDLQGQVEAKDAEIDFFKKKMKNTKINELQMELEEVNLYLLDACTN